MRHEIRSSATRPRSPLFRALGADNPPQRVEIQNHGYHLETVFKHDSWAATALYVSRAGKAVCKFNRRQPILGIPMHGLGGRWPSVKLKCCAGSPTCRTCRAGWAR